MAVCVRGAERGRGGGASGGPGRGRELRGPKKRAKSDRTDARLLRTLLWEGRLPESAIPPAHVLEVRTLGRLYCALMDERRAWQQRIHAQLFHQGCPPITALLSQTARDGLAAAELSPAGRYYVEAALRRIDELTDEIEPVRTQLVDLAKRQPGCRALQARHYGVGWLCAAIMWAEIGDARRFHSSDQLVRFAGLDVTVYSSDGKRSPGHLSKQGSPALRWAAYEAAKSAARPARRITPTTTRWPSGCAARNKPAAKTPPSRSNVSCCAAAITPCVSSVMPRWHRRPHNATPPEMHCARAMPTNIT